MTKGKMVDEKLHGDERSPEVQMRVAELFRTDRERLYDLLLESYKVDPFTAFRVLFSAGRMYDPMCPYMTKIVGELVAQYDEPEDMERVFKYLYHGDEPVDRRLGTQILEWLME